MTTDTTAGSLQELQDLIHEKYGIDRADLGPEASMRDKGFDSLALVEFLFAVEDHFKISLPDTDENMTTLGQLSTLVDGLLAKKAAGAARVPVPAGSTAAAADAPVVAPPNVAAPHVAAPVPEAAAAMPAASAAIPALAPPDVAAPASGVLPAAPAALSTTPAALPAAREVAAVAPTPGGSAPSVAGPVTPVLPAVEPSIATESASVGSVPPNKPAA